MFINGKPAAVQGDKTGCGGSIVSGASGVFINGKPMARQINLSLKHASVALHRRCS